MSKQGMDQRLDIHIIQRTEILNSFLENTFESLPYPYLLVFLHII